MVLGVQIYETTIIDTWRGLSIYRWIKLDQARSITYYSNKKDVGGGEKNANTFVKTIFHLLDRYLYQSARHMRTY